MTVYISFRSRTTGDSCQSSEEIEYLRFKKNFFVAGLIIIAVYGALDEIHQIFITNRSCEFLDWVADIIGGLLGTVLTYFFIKKNTAGDDAN